MTKVKDLIGKPNFDIDSTMNVVLFKEMEKSMNQIKHTIITPSIKRILDESLNSIYSQIINFNPPTYQCFLIEGIFGSGKSHVLSFINALFDNDISIDLREHLWEKIQHTFKDQFSKLKEKNFLVVPIALHERRQEDLIDIIFREMEKLIQKIFKVKVDLSAPSKYIEYYNKKCPSGIKTEIEKNIPDLKKFNSLDEEDDLEYYRKAELIRQAMEECHIQIKDSYKIGDDLKKSIQLILEQSFRKTEQRVQAELNIDGIILIIDEFSEYLKTKKKAEFDDEGHKRTLASIQIQYLAEYAKGKNIFIFIAAQEAFQSLDPLFIKQAQTGGRLKTLPLEYHHFVDIFNKLILPEKDKFKRDIKSLFPNLKINFFNNSKYAIYDDKKPEQINADIFYDCYPFHPKTIEILMNNIFKYATKTRAGLTYTQDYLKRSLTNDINDLIAPDTLYDYFDIPLKSSEPKKFGYIENLRFQIKASLETTFKNKESLFALKALKYIYINLDPVFAHNLQSDLLINNLNINDIENILDKLYNFSRSNLQLNYLRRDYDPVKDSYKYYIQIRGDFDVEEQIHILSKKINEKDLYKYFLSKYWDTSINKENPTKWELQFSDWKGISYYILHNSFLEILRDINDYVSELPQWTPKEIIYIELFLFFNLPFNYEYSQFEEDYISNIFQKFQNPKLKERLYFILYKPLDNLIVSEIKKSLAYDLISNRFSSKDKNWWGSDDIQREILENNNEILEDLNKFYNEFEPNKDEILSQISKLQTQFSLQKTSPLFKKIDNHLQNNFKVIGLDGEISTIEKDYTKVLQDKLEMNVTNFYPDFPDFQAKTNETRYINIILNEMYKDQNIFEITANELSKLKGKVITGIAEKLGIFCRKSENNRRNIFFKIGFLKKNHVYKYLMELIPSGKMMEEKKSEQLNLAEICEKLRGQFGFSLEISRITLATLLHQDEIKIKDKRDNSIYDNSHVKYILNDNIRDFQNFLVYQPKKLEKNEILWIFTFFNSIFNDNDKYLREFAEEIKNIDEIDELKSAKQKLLINNLRNLNLDEYNNLINKIKNFKEDILGKK